MDSEMTIALIGAGSALLGALIGGGAAVIGASKAARSAYLGPIRVARRAEQAAAHKGLLTAANDYDIAVSHILRMALELNQHVIAQTEGRQGVLGHSDVVAYRAEIERVGTADRVVAAVRHVALQGPKEAYEAAEGVRRMAHILEYSLAHLEAVSFGVIVAEPCRPAWLSSWLCWPVIAPCQGRPLMRNSIHSTPGTVKREPTFADAIPSYSLLDPAALRLQGVAILHAHSRAVRSAVSGVERCSGETSCITASSGNFQYRS
ncbi:hypothetical protein ACWDBT_34385 [Streptomyces ardesiacus]